MYDNVIECLIERTDPLTRKPAPTIFHIGKVQYIFAPRPELTGDENANVCIVISQEHRDYLLNDKMCSSVYRKYVPKVKVANADEILERAEFEEWKRLRKTLTAEEILEMTKATVGGDEDDNAPASHTPPEPVVHAPATGVQSAPAGSTAVAGNTTKPKGAGKQASTDQAPEPQNGLADIRVF